MRNSLSPVVPARTPAALYVRMSDEGQQYSIANQTTALEEYADREGFSIVRTYADAAKSGVVLKHRTALRDLLEDVAGGKADYKAILVYDVSRWGRFPNSDEAAHYEFLCRNAGVPLHYCAEPFANDDTPSSSILKALKRSMAAEFSRELGDKVTRGKTRLVQMGFWVGGPAGYGYRRMMVSADGKHKQKLKDGEHKSITTDRIILVPGPRKEVECVRHMYSMVIEGRHGACAIARDLNSRGIACYGKQWTDVTVREVLVNPKYKGWNVWHRRTVRLGSKLLPVPREQWITKPGAFAPLVDEQTFDRVQAILPTKADRSWTDDELLKRVKRLLKAGSAQPDSNRESAGNAIDLYTTHSLRLLSTHLSIGGLSSSCDRRIQGLRKDGACAAVTP
jgi:DNA invertase Pin-like site-specific DNA recombinase